MQGAPIAKHPVLIQLSSGLYLGLVFYNPQFESLKFVLEKREFFEIEWPALVISQERGLMPILLGFPFFTIQRSQIIWYTTHIPKELISQYQAYLPVISQQSLPAKEKQKNQKMNREEKIIPFPKIPKEKEDGS